jgi:hypothetical protein
VFEGQSGSCRCSRSGGKSGENDGVYSRNLPDQGGSTREDSEGIQVRAFALPSLPSR